MDQPYGSQEELEPARPEGSEAGVRPYRLLAESSVRLHHLVDPERLVLTAIEVIRGIAGECPGVLIIFQDDEERPHGFGGGERETAAGRVPAHARSLTDRAMESGHAVVDGRGSSRAVAVPLLSGSRLVGALYMEAAGLEKRLGASYLDLLNLLGRHLAVAMENAQHVRDLTALSGAGSEEALASGLSLRESKRLYERRLIRARLREARGNIAGAARSLRMDRGQLSRLLKRHGIDKSRYRQPR